MASLSEEEENYVRKSLLLTRISPRAVRTFFDSEFVPACLDASLKKEFKNLLDLKNKHRINQSQWNLLFPRFPAADLARIKHYRNHLAHLEDGKIDTTFFNTAWTNITGAIERLGGQQMKQECDHLRTKPLDQSNQEIMMDTKRSNNEIQELKESFKSLKLSHTEMLKSHELLQEHHVEVQKFHKSLQEDQGKVKTEIEIMKTSQMDTVPWNIRGRISATLKDWKDYDDKTFVNTRAARHVLKCIQDNSCVTITASSGVGKTSTLRHVASQVVEEYDVILVTEPGDILRFDDPNKKILFVVDDLCGNFSLDESDIKSWEPFMESIEKILDKKQNYLQHVVASVPR
ncbi:unnamed protein product [Mytilus coruscus]|uniref:Uncharacterized protein n=1 Tax=Mytilus coruscus TaxID=42192 RepID=A0A6J8EII4_MYTCO|nr:unnamed protein product [Mytilus coruscus]